MEFLLEKRKNAADAENTIADASRFFSLPENEKMMYVAHHHSRSVIAEAAEVLQSKHAGLLASGPILHGDRWLFWARKRAEAEKVRVTDNLVPF